MSPAEGDVSTTQSVLAELRSVVRRTRAAREAPRDEAEVVVGDYRLVGEIGQGGMGTVWEAEQLSLRRRVALKLLSPHLSLSVDAVQRFRREAIAGGRLSHPGIVGVLDVGESDGVHYIAQELVEDGLSLADVFAALHGRPELPADYFRVVAEWFEGLADALAVAHAAEVVHRDLKPGNVLIGTDGQPKIADFGLAKINDDLVLSRTGQLAGTPFYMSPEQAASQRIGIDHRTDVFSLGATLYEALTLRRPFEGDTSQQVLEQILLVDPPDPRALRSKVPRDLAVICLKALEKRREQRYQTMAEFGADLRRFLNDEPIAAQPPGPVSRAFKWTRRHRATTAAGAVAVAALVVITSLWLRALKAEADVTAESDAKDAALGEKEVALAEKDGALARAIAAEDDAQDKARAARWQSYVANLRAAEAALEMDEYGEAQRRLAECPEEHRAWEWFNLSLRADASLSTLRGHRGRVTAVACSPDGQRLASVSDAGDVRLWDLDSFALISESSMGSSDPMDLAYSPDGLRIVLTWSDGKVTLFDGRTLALISRQLSGLGPVMDIAFAPDGQWFVTTSALGELAMWRSSTGERFRSLRGAWGCIGAVCVSPDGSMIASGGGVMNEGMIWSQLFADRALRLWNAETGEQVAESVLFEPPSHWSQSVVRLAFSSDGSRLLVLSCSKAQLMLVPDLDVVWANQSKQEAIAVSPDGTRWAFGSEGSLGLWADGPNGLTQLRSLTEKKGPVYSADFSADGSRLATAGSGGVVYLWNGVSGELEAELRAHTGDVRELDFSPDGRFLVSGSTDGTIRIWDSVASDVVPSASQWLTSSLGTSWGSRNSHSQDGSEVSVFNTKGMILVFDTASGSLLRSIRVPAMRVLVSPAMSADGERIACETGKNRWQLIHLATGNAVDLQFSMHAMPDGVLFSPDGGMIAFVSGGEVHLLDAVSGSQLRVLSDESLKWNLNCAAFSPDSQLVAAGTSGGDVRWWDARSGLLLGARDAEDRHSTTALVFAPRQAQLAVGAGNGVIRIVSLDTRKVLTILSAHDKQVNELAYSPDGQRLVSASIDGTARVWDIFSGEALATLRIGGNVTSAFFNGDGTRIITCSASGGIQSWETERSSLEAQWRAARVRRRIEPVVRRLFERRLFVEGVLAGLQQDPSLSPELREEATRLALTKGDAVGKELTELTWNILRDDEGEAAAYSAALQAACRLCEAVDEPEPHDLLMKGIAEYRCGSAEAAVRTISRAFVRFPEAASQGRGMALAFLAMALQASGDELSARSALEELRGMGPIVDPAGALDEDLSVITAEAEAKVGSAAADTGSAVTR